MWMCKVRLCVCVYKGVGRFVIMRCLAVRRVGGVSSEKEEVGGYLAEVEVFFTTVPCPITLVRSSECF